MLNYFYIEQVYASELHPSSYIDQKFYNFIENF